MKLRPYQKEIVSRAARFVAKNKRVIVQLSTGGGKTIIFSFIIKRHLQSNAFNRVLVLTHREELFKQSRTKIEAIAGKPAAKLKAGMRVGRQHSEASIVVSMIETLKRRDLSKLGKFSLVIVDEAHRNDFLDILNQLPDSTYVLGFTATPISANKEKPLKGSYNNIVTGVKIADLISKGYLAKPVHYKAEFGGEKLGRRGGEFTTKSQMEQMGRRPVYENLVDLWKERAEGKKTLVFNVNKKHTREVNAQFRSEGIRSTDLLSGDSQRAEKLEAFESGDITVLNNCDIASTGFDVPSIECVLINRATESLPLWLQMVGRASRPAPGKDRFLILDFGGNIDRHGMWHLQRDWKDIFWNPPEKGINPAPMKDCPKCGALNFGGASECEMCGHEFQHNIETKDQQTVIGYLRKVGQEDVIGKRIDDLSIEELVQLEKAEKYKASYIARVARTRGEDVLKKYAKLKGYSSGWLHYQRDMDTGYKNYKVKL